MGRKVKRYGEPWVAVKSTAWQSGFRTRPTHGDTPEEAAQVVKDWEAKKLKVEQDADWFVRGSNFDEPTVCQDLLGPVTVHDGGRLILTATRMLGLAPDAPDHRALAERACECVNACQGIADPVRLIRDVRAMLLDLARGLCDPDDVRVVSCLGRMIPPEELQPIED